MQMNIQFRKLTVLDSLQAYEVQNKTVQDLEFDRQTFITTTLKEFQAMIKKNLSYGLFVDGVLAGYVLNYKRAKNRTVVMDTILVNYDNQGNGLGKLLTGFCINQFTALGYVYETAVSENNHVSYNNLTAAGFVDVDQIINAEEETILLPKPAMDKFLEISGEISTKYKIKSLSIALLKMAELSQLAIENGLDQNGKE
jgi:L-amino acid N-acyltransferase YncA